MALCAKYIFHFTFTDRLQIVAFDIFFTIGSNNCRPRIFVPLTNYTLGPTVGLLPCFHWASYAYALAARARSSPPVSALVTVEVAVSAAAERDTPLWRRVLLLLNVKEFCGGLAHRYLGISA